MAAILESASVRGGQRKTRIMYQTNMSFKLLEKYLKTVLSLGFVQFDGSFYQLTPNGWEFLVHFRRFQEHLAQAQNHFQVLDRERSLLHRMCQDPGLLNADGSLMDETRILPRDSRKLLGPES